ncbi:hypothetical protein B0H13DRAFT_1907339 [Mycena leptocephala]|nr:hypothetical protein B0H13DRAFT_1907339 [Mycena leptocephala]
MQRLHLHSSNSFVLVTDLVVASGPGLLQKNAVNRFALLAEESPEVPKLPKKSYSDFELPTADWMKIEQMHEVLQEPANIQQSFSSAKYPTVWRTLPLLELLTRTWENMAATDKFADMNPFNMFQNISVVALKDMGMPGLRSARVRKNHLMSPTFMNQVKEIAQLATADEAEAKSWFRSEDFQAAQTAIGLFGATIAAGAAPVIGALGIPVWFGNLVANVYRDTPETLRCFMGYLIDLTPVLNELFTYNNSDLGRVHFEGTLLMSLLWHVGIRAITSAEALA